MRIVHPANIFDRSNALDSLWYVLTYPFVAAEGKELFDMLATSPEGWPPDIKQSKMNY